MKLNLVLIIIFMSFSSLSGQDLASNAIGVDEVMDARGEKANNVSDSDNILMYMIWASMTKNRNKVRAYTKEELAAQKESARRRNQLMGSYYNYFDEKLHKPIIEKYHQGDSSKLYELFVANNQLLTLARGGRKRFPAEQLDLTEEFIEYGLKKEDSYAYFLSGFLHWENQDKSKAFFEKAEAMGYPQALLNYDLKIKNGEKYERIRKEIIENGNLDPLIELMIYYSGDEEDFKKYCNHYFTALGIVLGKYTYNKMYYAPGYYFDFGEDYKEAGLGLKTILKNNKKNPVISSQAKKLLGDYYMIPEVHSSENVPCKYNPKKAFSYYLESADAGFNKAYFPLGLLYLQGAKGVEKNERLARKYLELGAKTDSRDAKYYLAEVYEKGIGGPASIQKATQLYEEIVDKTGKKFDPISIKAYESLKRVNPKLIEKYQPRYFKKNIAEINAAVKSSKADIQILLVDNIKGANAERYDTISMSRAIEIATLTKKQKDVQWFMCGRFDDFSLDLFDYKGEAFLLHDQNTESFSYKKLAYNQKRKSVDFKEFNPKWTEPGYPGVFIYENGRLIKFFGRSNSEGSITSYVEQLLK